MGSSCSSLPTRQAPSSQLNFNIDDVCASVQAGDILLFSGRGLSSACIELFTASQWSHIGVVIEDTDPHMKGEPLLLESVSAADGVVDACNDDNAAKGVRVVRLRRYLNQYRGAAIAVRHLQVSTNQPQFVAEINLSLLSTLEALHGRPYERRWTEFVMARFCTMMCAFKQTPDSFFCSELVAHCYQKAGLLDPSSASPNSFLPDDFCASGMLHIRSTDLMHYGTISLGPEKYVDLSARPLLP